MGLFCTLEYLLVFGWLRLVAHHWIVHLLFAHILKLLQISLTFLLFLNNVVLLPLVFFIFLTLFFFLTFWFPFWFLLFAFFFFLFFFLLFLMNVFFYCSLSFIWSFRMLPVFMWVNQIISWDKSVNWSLFFILVFFELFFCFWFIIQYRVTNFVWFHVIEN